MVIVIVVVIVIALVIIGTHKLVSNINAEIDNINKTGGGK